jgi:2-desacetyl-2-hydroxyethyl bacteriochlorophyllide A dehydrogenase
MEATYVAFTAKEAVEICTEEVSAESLAPMEALIRNETSILSAGTELSRLHGLEKDMNFPIRPGYGSIGRIEALGEGIDDFRVGDRVFYAGKHASLQRFTHGENHQWAYLFPVPDSLDPIDASAGCMAEIAMTAPNATQLKLGDTVAVFGLGMVGNLAAQFYKLAGARVIGVDPVRQRCDLARQVGIDEVIDAAPDGQVEAVKDLTKGEGAQVTVDAAGHSAVIESCVSATALFGQVLLLGTPRARHEGDVTQVLKAIHSQGLVVRGAHMWRYPVRGDRNVGMSVSWAFENVFGMIADGRLKVRPLISHVVRPEEVPGAYEGLDRDRMHYTGVVIDWR